MDKHSFYGSSKRKRVSHYVTLAEAVEEEVEAARFIILPPDSGDKPIPSDEEDDDAENLPEPPGEIEAEVEEVYEDSESSSDESDIAEHLPEMTWSKNKSFVDPIGTCVKSFNLEEKFPQYVSLTPYELFCLIFDQEIVDLIVSETQKYANRDKNEKNFQTNSDEIRQMLGILLISGYHQLPSQRHYWSADPDLGVPMVRDTMSRARFETLKRYLHLADNLNLEKGNKVAKVSPLYAIVNKKLLQFGIFHEKCSVDEQMVPYRGLHSARMFMKDKPVRFGYKIWGLAGSDGYPYCMKIYTGKEEISAEPERKKKKTDPREKDPRDSLGGRVVLQFAQVVLQESDPLHHKFFFDNFFSSYGLFRELKIMKLYAVGTIRENRAGGASAHLISSKDLKRKERGSYDSVCDGIVYINKWHDNSIVCTASNAITHNPVRSVTRRKKGGTVNTSQPALIHEYNKGMGGVDLLDRLVAAYRPTIRTKKWWWPLFSHALVVMVTAAYRVHCNLHKHGGLLTHLDFVRYITKCLLEAAPSSRGVGGGHHGAIPVDIRVSLNHEKSPTTQGRCIVCHKNTRIRCSICNVRIHHDRNTDCWKTHHSK